MRELAFLTKRHRILCGLQETLGRSLTLHNLRQSVASPKELRHPALNINLQQGRLSEVRYPRIKQLNLNSFLKDTCTSPPLSREVAAKAARRLKSQIHVRSPRHEEPGRSPCRGMTSKQLTLDQMVLEPIGLDKVPTDNPRFLDGYRPQVESGFVLGSGHDTLDL